jgi:ubiquinone/menaquinone biosynthesis C-methylase UbiE
MRVLDVGAGTGKFGIMVEYYMHGVFVDSVDRVPRGDVVKLVPSLLLPYAGDSFDAITCLSVIQYVENKEALCSEFRRVLKDGGTLYIVYPSLLSTHGRHKWFCDNALHFAGFDITVKKKIGGKIFGYTYIEAVKHKPKCLACNHSESAHKGKNKVCYECKCPRFR